MSNDNNNNNNEIPNEDAALQQAEDADLFDPALSERMMREFETVLKPAIAEVFESYIRAEEKLNGSPDHHMFSEEGGVRLNGTALSAVMHIVVTTAATALQASITANPDYRDMPASVVGQIWDGIGQSMYKGFLGQCPANALEEYQKAVQGTQR